MEKDLWRPTTEYIHTLECTLSKRVPDYHTRQMIITAFSYHGVNIQKSGPRWQFVPSRNLQNLTLEAGKQISRGFLVALETQEYGVNGNSLPVYRLFHEAVENYVAQSNCRESSRE